MERLTGLERIKEMAPMERPREKFRRLGADALSDVELLAMLMGSGTAKFPVLAMCENLIGAAGGSLQKLVELDLETLCGVDGIGEVRAMSFLATVALAKRLYSLKPEPVVPQLDDDTFSEFLIQLTTSSVDDEFTIVLLTGNRELLAAVGLAGTERSLPEVAHLVRIAFDAGASRFFLAVNFEGLSGNDFCDFYKNLSAAANIMQLEFEGLVEFNSGVVNVMNFDE